MPRYIFRVERREEPEVGSIGPVVGQAGISVTIAGDGFGSSQGSVKVEGRNNYTYTVPTSGTGNVNVTWQN